MLTPQIQRIPAIKLSNTMENRKKERMATINSAKQMLQQQLDYFQNHEIREIEQEQENQRVVRTVMNLIRAENDDWVIRQQKENPIQRGGQKRFSSLVRKRIMNQQTRTSALSQAESRPSTYSFGKGNSSTPSLAQPIGHSTGSVGESNYSSPRVSSKTSQASFPNMRKSKTHIFMEVYAAQKASHKLAELKTTKSLKDSSTAPEKKHDLEEDIMVKIEILKKQLKKIPENRSSIALEIGQKYEAAGGLDKAVEYYIIGTKHQELKRNKMLSKLEEENEKRKVERMTEAQRISYLASKKKEEDGAQLAHHKAQNQACHDCHLKAFDGFLRLKQPDKALEYMEKWISLFHTDDTKVEAYKTVEKALSDHEGLKARDRSFSNAIRKQALSVLDDYHIKVLNILLQAHPSDEGYLRTLGTLYTKRQDLGDAASRFRQYVDLANETTLADLPDYRTANYYAIKAQKSRTVPKEVQVVSYWQQGNATDSEHRRIRDDFTQPGAVHSGSSTVMYSLPPTGWDSCVNDFREMRSALPNEKIPVVIGKYASDLNSTAIN